MRNETSPEDVHGMLVSEGILTARGGLVSHAAVVARGWGKPAVVGRRGRCASAIAKCTANGITLNEGDWRLARRGDRHRRGRRGAADRGRAARRVRHHARRGPTPSARATWASGPTPTPATTRPTPATSGPRGSACAAPSTCSSAEDRLPVVRRMILAQTPAEESRQRSRSCALVQREDFIAILDAMDGLPVTVRLLDPPLHEFLPSTEELALKEATVGLNAEERRLYEAALSWKESNPMLGTRGVRLGVIKPGLYAMQVRALMEAARQRVADGGHPIVEIMIPLTVTREELALARGWVEDAVAEVNKEPAPKPSKGAKAATAKRGQLEVTIGTMIETPRAALRAAEIAEVADFFSFGTNDLTQMTFGFSRDDVEGRMMDAYLRARAVAAQPLRGGRLRRRGGAGAPRDRAGPRDAAGPQGRRLRRARGRPPVHRPVLRRRAGLRELLALPGPGGPPGCGPGRPGGRSRDIGHVAPPDTTDPDQSRTHFRTRVDWGSGPVNGDLWRAQITRPAGCIAPCTGAT